MAKIIKYIDLCCGIGGFRIGIQNFEKINKNYIFKCVYSIDNKQSAVNTYNINFNENLIAEDIYLKNDYPHFDLLCCGFPCQPFSSAGQKLGFDDERGGIIFRIIDICNKYKPKYILLENVYNLLILNKGEVINKIIDLFQNIGYFVTYKKLNSKNFGVPQSRERVYIICTKNKINIDTLKFKPEKILNTIIETNEKYSSINKNLENLLLNLHKKNNIYGNKLQDKRGGINNINSWTIGLNGKLCDEEINLMNLIMTQRRKKHWAKKKDIDWMDGMPLTKEEIKTFYDHKNLELYLNNLVNLNYLKLEKCKELINGKRIIKENSEIGYNICKGKLSFPISTILNPYSISPTLTATDSDKLAVIIDDKYIRKLTNNEIKLICGFPIDFIIPDNVNVYDLFGNMVVPDVITSLLQIIF